MTLEFRGWWFYKIGLYTEGRVTCE